jgi:dTDP-4-amino-4,6-dideoxygalactose transaminase
MQPAYADLGLAPGAFPRTERSAPKLLSLPMFAELTSGQLESVVDALANCRRLVAV